MSPNNARSWVQHLCCTLNCRRLVWACPRWLRALLVILVALVYGTLYFFGASLLLTALLPMCLPGSPPFPLSLPTALSMSFFFMVFIVLGRIAWFHFHPADSLEHFNSERSPGAKQ